MAASFSYPETAGSLEAVARRERRRARPLAMASAIVLACLALAGVGNAIAHALGPWQAPAHEVRQP